jgi:hypothetical protein
LARDKKSKSKHKQRHLAIITDAADSAAWAEKHGLSKETATIKKEVEPIDRHTRRLLHELWPEFIFHSLSQLEVSMWRMYSVFSKGLTPGEREVLKQARSDIMDIRKRVDPIYYRLKFTNYKPPGK